MKHIAFLFLFSATFASSAQKVVIRDSTLVQFSGVVVTADSLDPVPFATIYEKRSRMGTISDYYGYYSFVAQKGDTIMFSCLGFKTEAFVIPDTLSDYRYSIIQLMSKDTITLKPFVRYPWPSREEFASAFVNQDISDFGYAQASKNMRDQDIILRINGIGSDAYLSYKWDMYQQQQHLYHQGQMPPINLFNPIAWAQFVKAWKSGAFKQ